MQPEGVVKIKKNYLKPDKKCRVNCKKNYFFFAGAFFASGFLTSGFFAAAFFAAAMVDPPPTGKG
jgi:hypothetical protein